MRLPIINGISRLRIHGKKLSIHERVGPNAYTFPLEKLLFEIFKRCYLIHEFRIEYRILTNIGISINDERKTNEKNLYLFDNDRVIQD